MKINLICLLVCLFALTACAPASPTAPSATVTDTVTATMAPSATPTASATPVPSVTATLPSPPLQADGAARLLLTEQEWQQALINDSSLTAEQRATLTLELANTASALALQEARSVTQAQTIWIAQSLALNISDLNEQAQEINHNLTVKEMPTGSNNNPKTINDQLTQVRNGDIFILNLNGQVVNFRVRLQPQLKLVNINGQERYIITGIVPRQANGQGFFTDILNARQWGECWVIFDNGVMKFAQVSDDKIVSLLNPHTNQWEDDNLPPTPEPTPTLTPTPTPAPLKLWQPEQPSPQEAELGIFPPKYLTLDAPLLHQPVRTWHGYETYPEEQTNSIRLDDLGLLPVEQPPRLLTISKYTHPQFIQALLPYLNTEVIRVVNPTDMVGDAVIPPELSLKLTPQTVTLAVMEYRQQETGEILRLYRVVYMVMLDPQQAKSLLSPEECQNILAQVGLGVIDGVFIQVVKGEQYNNPLLRSQSDLEASVLVYDRSPSQSSIKAFAQQFTDAEALIAYINSAKPEKEIFVYYSITLDKFSDPFDVTDPVLGPASPLWKELWNSKKVSFAQMVEAGAVVPVGGTDTELPPGFLLIYE